MYKQERIKPYKSESEKGVQLERMFNNIAPTYDTLNHRLSMNIDKRWRKKALLSLQSFSPNRILDVATGTGDLAILAAQMIQPETIVGIDISEGMMEIGRRKVAQHKLKTNISLVKADCLSMPFRENEFDAVISAFGIRNLPDLDVGLREMFRVLKPGGHLSIIELTTPVKFPMRQLFYIYSHAILPVYGKLISKDSNAYQYLTRTIEAFPQGEKMTDILTKAGFNDATFKRLTCGICTMYFAKK